jgi:hypothetical protein
MLNKVVVFLQLDFLSCYHVWIPNPVNNGSATHQFSEISEETSNEIANLFDAIMN